MAQVAFIGLGVMGYPMAGHLRKAGHEVAVYNRTSARAEAWLAEYGGGDAEGGADDGVQDGAQGDAEGEAQEGKRSETQGGAEGEAQGAIAGVRSAATPREAAMGAEFVFACVGGDADVRAVTLGADGAFAGMETGAIFIDNTTTSADVAIELHGVAAAAGLGFVDAPVSGGQAGAEGGVLTVMCGGDEADYARAEPMLAAFGKSVRRIGGAGAGQQAKMVNQICIAGVLQGLAEGLHFGQKAGLDMEAVLASISGGAAMSWQMVNRGETMLDDAFDFGFAVDWMIKDLGFCVAEAEKVGAALPVAEIVLEYYREVAARGGGRWDTSSLIRRLG